MLLGARIRRTPRMLWLCAGLQNAAGSWNPQDSAHVVALMELAKSCWELESVGLRGCCGFDGACNIMLGAGIRSTPRVLWLCEGLQNAAGSWNPQDYAHVVALIRLPRCGWE